MGAIWLLIGTFHFFSFKLPDPAHPLQFYSSETRDDIKKIFCTCIRSAKDELSLSSYGYSDPDILRLIKGQKEAGVEVITHPPRKKGKGIQHRKYLIIDREILCLSSVNLTEPSLTVHNNIALLFFHPPLAKHVQESLYYEDESLTYYPIPSQGKKALEHILSLIDGSNRSIKVAMFTFTHPACVDALIRAKGRGVDVEVLLDKQTAKAASKKAYQKLKEAGITVRQNRGKQLFHYKCALIDEETLIFGSANWTQSAFRYNNEDLLIVRDLSKEHKKFLRRLFTSIRFT